MKVFPFAAASLLYGQGYGSERMIRYFSYVQSRQAFLIAASAEGKLFAGPQQDAVTVAIRDDYIDIIQIYNIAVVASEKQTIRKLFQNLGYLSVFAEDAAFTVKDQTAPVCLDKTAFGVIELEMTFSGIQPEKRLGHRDIDLQLRIVVLNGILEMLDEFIAAVFRNFADGKSDFVHK